MLIHSCLYYHLNCNIITDAQWDKWARELNTLQTHYPDIAKQVILYEYFSDWDASTGAFLPITEPWVVAKAKTFMPKKAVVKTKPKKSGKKKLF